MIIRCYLLASSLARLIHRERGTARVVEGSFRTRSGQILSVQVENDVGNRYEDDGAAVRLEFSRFWRMVRPSGTEAPGARSAGRPMCTMS